MNRTLALVVISQAASLVAAGSALARTPLSEQPAVRHRYELRDSRLEVAPTFEASIAADFQHTLSGGLKLEYHITDAISIGALGFFGASLDTGLLDKITSSLPAAPQEDGTPSKQQARDHVNRMPIHGGVGLTFTPWFGKMGLFGKAFLSYDLYISGGFGFAITKNDFAGDDDTTVCDVSCDDPAMSVSNDPRNNDPRNDGPHNAGFNAGVQYGGGLHIYFSNFAALDIYLRNYMFSDNPSGLNFNGDRQVSGADRRFLSHLFVGIGVSLFLPPRAKISR